MSEFTIKIRDHEVNPATRPFVTVQALCEQLTEYGYEALCEEQQQGSEVCLSVSKDGETYYEAQSYLLQPTFVTRLARFTERAYVQYTLDRLLSRMSALGYLLELETNRILFSQKALHVTRPNGVSTDYALNYTDMLRLCDDIDRDEVDYIIGSNLHKILARGGKRLPDSEGYTFRSTDGTIMIIPPNDPQAAEHIAFVLTLDCSPAGKATTAANSTAAAEAADPVA